MVKRTKNGEMMNGKIMISRYCNIVCESISLGQTCNTTCFLYFSKYLENLGDPIFQIVMLWRLRLKILPKK